MKNLLPVPLVLLLAGCVDAPVEKERAATPAAIPVDAVAATTTEWPVIYEATGTIHARTSAVISSKLTAYVREVKAQIGDHVREGQVLVTLDARDLEAGIRRSDAAREEVRASIPEADSALVAAKASLDLAEVTLKRMQELYDKKSVTDQELDEASARVKAARAAQDMTAAKRAQLNSRLAQVEQEARAAEIAHSYAEVTAPFGGTITAKSVEPGTLATPGAQMFTIEREVGYRLEASIEEARLAAIHAGQPVSVTLAGMNKPIEARVSEIVPTVDPATRTYIVKIDLPGIATVRSGMFGRASFQLGERSVVAIPMHAVSERGQMQSVMVAAEGLAHTRLITQGQRDKDQVEVLSGLQAGEMVIAPVPQGVSDGTRVEVRQ